MNAKHVEINKEGHLGWLTLLQSTITPEFIQEFHQAMNELENDPIIRTILVKGSGGKTFFAGYNVTLMQGEVTVSNIKGSILETQRIMNRLEHSPKPVIATVDGFALGGGCELVMASDIAVASERSKFGLPEVKLGLIPAAGGTIRLPRRVGKHRAMEMILTGRMYTAQEAFGMGLINRVVPPESVLEEARKMGQMIAENAPIAVRAAKATSVYSEDLLDKQMELYTVEKTLECLISQDLQEGVAAFLQKRKPEFHNK